MLLAEVFFPIPVLAATNSCLIMTLQIQQIQLLGRSRRHNLKHKLKIRQKVIWKFGVKFGVNNRAANGLPVPRQHSCFPSRITESVNSRCPVPLLLEVRGCCIDSWPKGGRGGCSSLWNFFWVRVASQVPHTNREGSHKNQYSSVYSLNPYIHEI